jgi:hypothetical protein
MSSISFAETTRLRGLYKNSYEITRTELIEYLETTDVKFICQEFCTKKVTVYVVKDKDTGDKTWVWTIDQHLIFVFNREAYDYDYLIEYDENRQITWINFGSHFPEKKKRVLVDVTEREYNSDLDWKEIRRRTQDSIDAHSNDL